MTACTICGLPTPGRDDDDTAWCEACYSVHVARAELVPRVCRTPQGDLRLVPAVRVRGAPEDGREAP